MYQTLVVFLLFASGKPALTELSAGGIELRRAFEKAERDVRMVQSSMPPRSGKTLSRSLPTGCTNSTGWTRTGS